jgi:hypothetical protein
MLHKGFDELMMPLGRLWKTLTWKAIRKYQTLMADIGTLAASI